jgi:serine/threonine-protein kinase
MLDFGSANGFRYYVMPFVSGPTLCDRIREEQGFPIDEAIAITSTVLEGLEYAHRKNVIHRDIKPENVLLQDGRALVADFGIARAIVLSGGDQISSTGIVIGTPTYMSPEQAAGEIELDGRSDVYSTGCLLYELLAGEPPFTGPTAQAVHARHKYDTPPSIRVIRADVPGALEDVVMKALAKDPADRFQSAAVFLAALGGGTSEPDERPLPRSPWWRFGRAAGPTKSPPPAPE